MKLLKNTLNLLFLNVQPRFNLYLQDFKSFKISNRWNETSNRGLRDNGRKDEHWAWWAWPRESDKENANEAKVGLKKLYNIDDLETAKTLPKSTCPKTLGIELLLLAPESWKICLELFCELLKSKGISKIGTNTGDNIRINEFIQMWAEIKNDAKQEPFIPLWFEQVLFTLEEHVPTYKIVHKSTMRGPVATTKPRCPITQRRAGGVFIVSNYRNTPCLLLVEQAPRWEVGKSIWKFRWSSKT